MNCTYISNVDTAALTCQLHALTLIQGGFFGPIFNDYHYWPEQGLTNHCLVCLYAHQRFPLRAFLLVL